MEHDGAIVAGTVARVRMSGHADWGGPTDEFTTPYDLYLFVQNPDVEPRVRRRTALSCRWGSTWI
jgi:hypothetical protein